MFSRLKITASNLFHQGILVKFSLYDSIRQLSILRPAPWTDLFVRPVVPPIDIRGHR